MAGGVGALAETRTLPAVVEKLALVESGLALADAHHVGAHLAALLLADGCGILLLLVVLSAAVRLLEQVPQGCLDDVATHQPLLADHHYLKVLGFPGDPDVSLHDSGLDTATGVIGVHPQLHQHPVHLAAGHMTSWLALPPVGTATLGPRLAARHAHSSCLPRHLNLGFLVNRLSRGSL